MHQASSRTDAAGRAVVRAAPPSAASLIESMRDVGYTLDTALADIIDNSISAGASRIRILAETEGPSPRIAIVDDGRGMSADDLLAAMRLGSRDPLNEIARDELGRFGLGMKTASFSQCRRLTVVTRTGGMTACARWDLDRVRDADEWLIELPDAEEVPSVDELGISGTLVVWEVIDRALGSRANELGSATLVNRLAAAQEHLQLVFHRFLANERRRRRLVIEMNGTELTPFDPFHERHDATVKDPPETIWLDRQAIKLQSYTLPHHSKLDADDWERLGGPAGYLRSQGFYVYRARRLIVSGTWFGLALQSEATKLCRVRIDMPNGLDAAWYIDIKKASAQPPPAVRKRLRQLIEQFGSGSKRVTTGKGRTLRAKGLPVWSRRVANGEVHYEVNEEHPTVADYSAGLEGAERRAFDRLMGLVAAGLPMNMIYADISADPKHVLGKPLPEQELKDLLSEALTHLRAANFTDDQIRQALRHADQFSSQWQRVEPLLEKTLSEARNG